MIHDKVKNCCRNILESKKIFFFNKKLFFNIFRAFSNKKKIFFIEIPSKDQSNWISINSNGRHYVFLRAEDERYKIDNYL